MIFLAFHGKKKFSHDAVILWGKIASILWLNRATENDKKHKRRNDNDVVANNEKI